MSSRRLSFSIRSRACSICSGDKRRWLDRVYTLGMETAVWTTLTAGAAGVLGGLLPQIVSARATLRVRQLEIYWQAKSGAYKGLIEQLGEFGSYPTNHAKYLSFLAAQQVALLFASDEVERLHRGPTGISVNAQRLRTAPTEEQRTAIIQTKWYEASEAVSTAMRNDLKRLDPKS